MFSIKSTLDKRGQRTCAAPRWRPQGAIRSRRLRRPLAPRVVAPKPGPRKSAPTSGVHLRSRPVGSRPSRAQRAPTTPPSPLPPNPQAKRRVRARTLRDAGRRFTRGERPPPTYTPGRRNPGWLTNFGPSLLFLFFLPYLLLCSTTTLLFSPPVILLVLWLGTSSVSTRVVSGRLNPAPDRATNAAPVNEYGWRGTGGCWHRLVDRPTFTPVAFEQDGYLCRDRLLNWLDLHQIGTVHVALSSIVRSGIRVYHVSRKPFANSRPLTRDNLARTKFDYRRPFHNALFGELDPNFFYDSPHRNSALSAHVASYIAQMRAVVSDCPWNVTEHIAKALGRLGINAGNPQGKAHPHPGNAAIERRLLQSVAQLLLPDQWTAIACRTSKLFSLPRPANSFCDTLTGRDFSRYKYEEDQPDIVIETPVAFAHDILQHLTPRDVGTWFDRFPALNFFFFTATLPAELTWRGMSENPDFYSLSYHGDEWAWTPEGDVNGTYLQPLEGARWRTTSHVTTPEGHTLHVSTVLSIMGHCLFLITRTPLLAEPTIALCYSDFTTLPSSGCPGFSLAARRVPAGIYRKVVDYTGRVQSTDPVDLHAKISNIVTENASIIPSANRRALATHMYSEVISQGGGIMLPGFVARFSILLSTSLVSLVLISLSTLREYSGVFPPPFVPGHGFILSNADIRFYVSVLFAILFVLSACSLPVPFMVACARIVMGVACVPQLIVQSVTLAATITPFDTFGSPVFANTRPWHSHPWQKLSPIVSREFAAPDFSLATPFSGGALRAIATMQYCLGAAIMAKVFWGTALRPVLDAFHPLSAIRSVWTAMDWTYDKFLLVAVTSIIAWYFELVPIAPLWRAGRTAACQLVHRVVPTSVSLRATAPLRTLFCLPGYSIVPTAGGSYAWQGFLFYFMVTDLFPGYFKWWMIPHRLLTPGAWRYLGTLLDTDDDGNWSVPNENGWNILVYISSLVLFAFFCTAILLVLVAIMLRIVRPQRGARLLPTPGTIPLYGSSLPRDRPPRDLEDCDLPPRSTENPTGPPQRRARPPVVPPPRRQEPVVYVIPAAQIAANVVAPLGPVQAPPAAVPLPPAIIVAPPPAPVDPALIPLPADDDGLLMPPPDLVPAAPAAPQVPAPVPPPAALPPAPAPAVPPAPVAPAPPVPVAPPPAPPAPAAVPQLGAMLLPLAIPIGPQGNLAPRPQAPDPTLAPWFFAQEDLTAYGELLSHWQRAPAPNGALAPLVMNESCFWRAASTALMVPPHVLWAHFWSNFSPNVRSAENDRGRMSLALIAQWCTLTGITVTVNGDNIVARGARQPPAGPPPSAARERFVYAGRNGFPTIALVLTYNTDPALPMHVDLLTTVDRSFVNATRDIAGTPRSHQLDALAPFMVVPKVDSRCLDVMLGVGAYSASTIQSLARRGYPCPLPPGLPYTPLPRQKLVPTDVMYTVNVDAAAKLASDLKAYPTTLEAAEVDVGSVVRQLDSAVKHLSQPPRQIRMTLLIGTPGSGKSTAVRGLLAPLFASPTFGPNSVRIHTASLELRAQVQRSMPIPGATSYNYPSGLVPLYESCQGTLVLDDAGKNLPGFVDLVIIANPALEHIIITGDCAQSSATFPKANCVSRTLPSIMSSIAPLAATYATEGWRLAVGVAQVLGLPVPENFTSFPGSIVIVSHAPADLPYLAASPRFVEVKNAGLTRTISFSDCQGIEFEGDYVVDLTGLTGTVTDYVAWTVLTRGRANVLLIAPPPAAKQRGPYRWGDSLILSTILAVASRSGDAVVDASTDPDHCVARAVHQHLRRACPAAAPTLFPLTPFATETIGYTPTAADLGMPQDLIPHTLPKLKASRRGKLPDRVHAPRRETVRSLLKHYAAITGDTVMPQAAPHLERKPVEPYRRPDPSVYSLPPVADRLDREVYVPSRGCLTNQIRGEHPQDPAWAPYGLHHSRSDKATEVISVEKRIHPVAHSVSKSLFRNSTKQGKLLISAFLKATRLEPKELDEAKLDAAVDKCLVSWLKNRSIVDVQRAVDNSPPDWSPLRTSLFLKAQMVKKLEKFAGNAAPGQIVTTFPMMKTFRDAVWATYLSDRILESLPGHIYLHAYLTNDEMRAWYKSWWKPSRVVTSMDYTAWDTGCNAPFLQFDVWLMAYYGLPWDYIQEYIYEKTHTVAHTGPMPIMQFSGDRYTWLFNTLRNIAITYHAIDIPFGEPIAFSGDDVAICGSWPKRKGFRPRSWAMVPKTVIADYAPFCGYRFGGDDCHPDDYTTFARAVMAAQNRRSDAGMWTSLLDTACALPNGQYRDAVLSIVHTRRAFLPPSISSLLPPPVMPPPAVL
jgi:hypothetical protein